MEDKTAVELTRTFSILGATLKETVRAVVREELDKIRGELVPQEEDPLVDSKKVCELTGMSEATLSRRLEARTFPEPAFDRHSGYHKRLWRRSQVENFMRQFQTETE